MMPIAGTINATEIAVSRVSIHGDVYYDLLVQADGEDEEMSCRAPSHAFVGGVVPPPGSRIRISFLMRQVTRVEPCAAA